MPASPTPSSPPPISRRLSLRRKILFTAVLLAVGLIALEGAVRVRAWVRYGSTDAGIADAMLVRHPETGQMAPRPGYVQESSKISIRINGLGFRGDDIAPVKPPRTIRIATVGASTTFCGEVSSNQATWPNQLQVLLQQAHPGVRFEVINAGVPGYVITQSLKNLERRVLPLAPDLVIYYEANNDLAVDTRVLAEHEGLVASASPGLGDRIAHYSLLFDLAQKNARIWFARQATEAKLGALPRDLPARYVGQLEAMQQLLAERQIPLVVSTFFVKYRRSQPRETQIANASVAFFYMPWLTVEGLLDGIDLYNDAIVDFGRRRGVPIVEDRDSIPGDGVHFADWAHFTDQGAVLMAQRFARFIEEQGTLAPAIARATSGASE
jgi:lysophospholipase L1-like esterase